MAWSLRDTRVKVGLAVVVALVAGGAARVVITAGDGDGFLAGLLPWLGGTDVTVYYGDATGEHLVPVSRTLDGDAESADGLIASLLAGPAEGTGLINLVPAGTTARIVSFQGGTLEVDLSEPLLGAESPLASVAVFHTLNSWPGVEQVRITVDGVPLMDHLTAPHLLFFHDDARDMLVAEPVFEFDPRGVLAAYLRGPNEAGLTGLPPDVAIVSYELTRQNRVLNLDFTYTPSVRRTATEDGDSMRRILEGLIATMTGFDGIDWVYLDFEGRASLGLGQCADLLRRMRPPPEVLNDERLLAAATGT